MLVSDTNPLLVRSLRNRVLTLRLNDPRRKNAWGKELLTELLLALEESSDDDGVGCIILTGTGDFFCSGVDFVSSFPIMRPSLLIEHIRVSNQRLFDTFLKCKKPIIVAANGPCIGAAVTASSLCDYILADPSATFHTPFAALGIVPEGCSSYWFEKIMTPEAAKSMLGERGWKPTANEALEAGLIHEIVQPDISQCALIEAAQALGEKWIASGKRRVIEERGETAKLMEVNAAESRLIAERFLSSPFLESMRKRFRSNGKTKLASLFYVLAKTRPLWSRL